MAIVSGEQLLFCADNLFSDSQYPDLALSTTTCATGYEGYHVATGRRHLIDRYQPDTANVSCYVQVTCDVIRAASFIAIDRESNHLGQRFVLYGSNDGFATSRTVFDITIPKVPGGTPAGAVGCVTDEGAWLKTFTPDAFHAWRLWSAAMGSGVTQQITGIHLGLAWAPSTVCTLEWQDEVLEMASLEARAPSGWVGRSAPSTGRVGSLIFKPRNEADYAMIRWQVMGLFAHGFPAWLCFGKTDYPQRAMMVELVPGTLDWSLRMDYPYRQLAIAFRESQPVWG